MAAADPARRLLTLSQVAEQLQVPESWVRTASTGGQIPAYKIGRRWRYDPAELETWLLSVRNDTDEPRPAPMRLFTESPPSLRHLEPKDAELDSAWHAEQVADALKIPVINVKRWISSSLIPGRKAGRHWLVTKEIAAEVIGVVTSRGHFEKLEPGRNRTGAATQAKATPIKQVQKQESYMKYKVVVTRVQVAERWVRGTDKEHAAQKVQEELERPYGYFGS